MNMMNVLSLFGKGGEFGSPFVAILGVGNIALHTPHEIFYPEPRIIRYLY